MRGDLSDTTVPAICRSLASQGASGRLVLPRGDQGPGTITLWTGSIADATSPLPRGRLRERLTGAGHLDELTMARVVHELRDASPEPDAGTPVDDAGIARALLDRQLADPDLVHRLLVAPVIDALVELFARRSGEYRFEVGAAEEPGSTVSGVHLEVERALVEVMRRADEVMTLPLVVRFPDTVPLLLLDLPATLADFDDETLTVIASIDDHSNLGEIARRVGYGFFDVARVVASLYERGVVALTQPQGGLTAPVVQTVDGTAAAAGHATGATRAVPIHRSPDPSTDDGSRDRGEFEEPRVGRAGTAGSTPAPPPDEQAPPDAAATSRVAGPTGPPASRDPAAVGNGATSRRSDDDDTDVSEFLRELSSLANRDDTRARRTASPAPTGHAGRREPHDGGSPGSGDDTEVGPRTDDDVESREEHRHPGSAPTSDGRKRRGFFGRG
jgi:hypothetical protein